MIFGKDKLEAFNESGEKLFEEFQKKNIYMIEPAKVETESYFLTLLDNVFLWHKKVGHVNFSQLENLSKKNLVNGLPNISIKDDVKCDTCLKNKMNSVSHKSKNLISTKRTLELPHLDLFGPTRILSLGGSKHGLVIVEDFSRFT